MARMTTQRLVLQLLFPELEPGQEFTKSEQVHQSTSFDAFRVRLLVAKPPDVKYYLRSSVRGSRRRGRNASNLWAAECLCVAKNPSRYSPLIVITSVRFGVNEQMVMGVKGGPLPEMAMGVIGGPIPVDLFYPGQNAPRLFFDMVRKGAYISITIKNLERSRIATIGIAMFGTSVA